MCVGGTRIEDANAASDAPTAIIASNSKLLFALLQAARQRGMVVPRDLSILAFNENEWGEYLDPPVTAIVQSTYEIGRRAFELLKSQIVEPCNVASEGVIRLEAELRIRGSTGKTVGALAVTTNSCFTSQNLNVSN